MEHGAQTWTVWVPRGWRVQFVYEVSDTLWGKTVHPVSAWIVRCGMFGLMLRPWLLASLPYLILACMERGDDPLSAMEFFTRVTT